MNASKPRLAGHILAGLVSLSLLPSAGAKLAGVQAIVDNLTKWHLGDYITQIGILEVVCAVLFAVPRTSSLGTLLVTGYMGGAVVAHLTANEPAGAVPALVIGALAWVANALRNRRMFESFSPQA